MRSFYKSCIVGAILITSLVVKAQNNSVAIGQSTTIPEAVLLLVGNGSQGLVIPKVNSLGSFGMKAMVVYNTADNKIYFHDGTAWNTVGGSGSSAQSISFTGNTIAVGSGSNTSVTLVSNPQANQFFMWNGTSWVGTTLSGDVSNTSGAITVTGIQGKQVSLPNSGIKYLSYDASLAQWVFQTPSGTGDMLKANNLSDVTNVATSRTNLGLGTLSTLSAVTSTEITDGTISNIDISNTAAIAGSKITPAFGAQNISTTGTLSSGAASLASVNIAGQLGVGAVPSFGTAGQVLTSSGAGVAPTWTTISGGGNMLSTNNLSDVANVATSRTNLGLGTLATLSAVTATEITDGTIANADISNTAAIAGSKITPVFGGQNISTTGTLSSGASTVSSLTVPGTTTLNSVSYTWPGAQGGAGTVLTNNGSGILSWGTAGSAGTVQSVGLTMPSLFTVTGSPITTTGTLAASLATQSANTVFAGPSGSVGVPAFRALVASDIPSLSASQIVSGTLPVAVGGTGAGSLTGLIVGNGTSAFTAITTGSNGQVLTVNAGAPSWQNAPGASGTAGGDLTGTYPNPTIATGAVTSTKLGTNAVANTNIAANAVDDTKILNVAPGKLTQASATSGQVLKWNGAAWAPAADNVGGGGAPTLNAGQIMVGDGVSNSAATVSLDATLNSTNGNFTVQGLQGRPISSSIPATNSVYQYNGTQWAPVVLAGGGTVTNIATGTGLTGGPITSTGTISISPGGVTTTELGASSVTNAKIATSAVNSSQIIDGSVVDADINSAASIAVTKLATGTNGQVLTVNSGVPSWQTPSSLSNPMNAAGDLIYGGAGGTPTKLATGTGFLKGGTTPIYSSVNLASADVSGTLPLTAGGTGAITATAARTNLGLGTLATLSAVTTTEITDGTIANVDVSNTAAIAGSKIAPAFGAQNISTTGTLSSGATTVTGLTVSGSSTTFNNKTYTWPNNPTLTAGTFLQTDASGNLSWAPTVGGVGTVTSVGLSMPSIFTVSNSPVISSGTLTATLNSQTANTFLAAPSGSAGVPTFRTLVAADVPNIDASKITTGTLPLANGGTGATTATAARTNLGLGSLATLSAVSTVEITDGTIADIDINSSAAIAGSKINPSFGSQNISTSGTLSSGATTVASINISGQLGVGAVPSFGTAGQVLTSAGAGLAPTWNTLTGGGNMLSTNNLSDVANVATARTNLGLGTLATLSAVTTTEITNGTIINADISGTAAIAGSKITPAFGTQNISTTGTLSAGATTVSALTIGTSVWPANASGVLTNDGTGALTWGTAFTNPMTAAGDIIYGGVSGAATRLATGTGFLKGGATPSYSSVNLASTDVSGTLPLTKGGTGATTAAAARTSLGLGTLATLSSVSTTEILDGTIADIDVSASANINGSKINPTFGAQALSTTSTLTTGSAGQFVVDATGNITKINNISTSFPSVQGVANTVLTNDGTGTLSWSAIPSQFSTLNTVPKGDGTGLIASSIFDNGTYTGIGRTTPLGATRLDIEASGFGANAYGGMYIQTDNQGSPFYGYSNNGGAKMWTYYHGTTGSWRVWNNGSDRLTITSSGNVGIGTTSPAYTLDVNGDAQIKPAIIGSSPYFGTSWFSMQHVSLPLNNKSYSFAQHKGGYTLINTPSNAGSNFIDFRVDDVTQMRVSESGNVGIGTTSPANKLDVAGNIVNNNPTQGSIELSGDLPGYTTGTYPTLKTSGNYLYLSAGGNYSGYLADGGAGASLILNNASLSASTVIAANGNTYFTGGNVGIGTTSPAQALDVNGNIHTSGNVYVGSSIYFPNAGAGQDIFAFSSYFGVTNHWIPNLSNSQDLGTATYRWRTLYTNNTVNVSDFRLKKDINNLKYGLSEILKMRPVSYIMKDDKEEETKLGLIAQEVRDLVPEVVSQNNDSKEKFLGMNYVELIPVLIKAIQEQQKIIDDQTKQIKELKSNEGKIQNSAQLELDRLNEEVASIKKALGLDLKASKKK